MHKKQNIYSEIKQFLLDNADAIQKEATEEHKKYIERKKFRSEVIEKYQKNHIKVVHELSNYLEKKDFKKGLSAFKKLAKTIANDSVNDGLYIEEAVDGIIFLKQALWKKVNLAGLLKKLSVEDYYDMSQKIGIFVDVVASEIAFTYHKVYVDKVADANKKHKMEEDQKNKALKYAEDVFATIREPLLVLDRELKVVDANKYFYHTFKVHPKDTEGKLIYKLGESEWNIPSLKDLLEDVLNQKTYFNDYEVTHTFPKIGKKIMLLNARRIEKSDMILLAIEDVTKRRAAEEKLLHSSAIVESSDDAIIGKNLQGVITSWNKGAEKIFGYKAEEMMGKNIKTIIPSHLWKEEDEILKRLKKGLSIEHFQTTRIAKNGKKIIVSLTISPIRNEKGEITGASKIARDITKQKELEQQKDDFMGIVSHELKTPVTSLKAYGQVLQKRLAKEGSTRATENLKKMDAQINKLSILIRDLLDITKIEGKLFKYKDEYYEFDDMVDEVVEDVQATTEKHKIIKRGNTGRKIKGDRERIEQVLVNMLTNAIKFSPKNEKIVVRTTIKNGEIVVSVEDRGVGIDKDKQAKVFERFYREPGIKQETYPGLGLGLYISREIIARHKGKMWVKSSKGKGSQFFFSLPLTSRPKSIEDVKTNINNEKNHYVKEVMNSEKYTLRVQ